MHRFAHTSAAALLLLLLMAASVGCEDSVLTAPTDATIVMAANPGTVVIDPNAGETEGSTTIVAQVFDANGNPLSGVAVLFATSGGSLASAGTTVTTNASGIATDTLTVTTNSPQESIVSAQSSAVSQGVSVFRDVVGVNEIPRASFFTIPAAPPNGIGEQLAGQTVIFDGSISVDPDGPIECFQWDINSNLGSCSTTTTQRCTTDGDCPGSETCGGRTISDEILQGPGLDSFGRDYFDEQSLTVILRVSDDPAIGAACGETAPPISAGAFNGTSFSAPFNITCNNQPPVANAGADQTWAPGTAAFILDARGSSDVETARNDLNFEWSCNTGFGPPGGNPQGAFLPVGSVVQCFLPPGVSDATFTPEVRVTDQGTGVIVGGSFECQKTVSDTMTVTVQALP
ncbi:hypothetical protein ABI59_02100 [Acidobacteria bacterium Mor1]|nr:hypothetical protein ABI59_02100 [Acidobacteria bacterium Mor1]